MSFKQVLEERRLSGLNCAPSFPLEAVHSRHDIRSSLNSIRLLTHMIKNGYRFDDLNADENLESLEKAVVCLESALLVHEYEKDL
jgi:hypothetical protein